MKTHNSATPKAVFAAIAASALTVGGDYIERAGVEVLREWCEPVQSDGMGSLRTED